MGILQINTELMGESGINPRLVRIVSDDNLATVTAAGYLNPSALQGYTIFPTDFIFMDYDIPILHDIFIPSIVNGIITLNLYTSSSGVNFIPPVIAGNFAVFANVSGDIQDVGFVASSPVLDTVVMVDTTPVAGHFATFPDTTGTISDNGYVPSNLALTNVVMQSGAAVVGDIAAYADVNGTIVDSGIIAADIVTATTPTVAGNFANFSNATGDISDQNFEPSDPAFSTVVLVNNTPVATHFATFPDTTGTITDAGYVPSDAALTNVVMESGASVVGNLPSYFDVNGSIQDSGFPANNIQPLNNIFANSVSWAGGGTTNTFTITGITFTPTSVFVPGIRFQNNAAYIILYNIANGTSDVEVLFSADPGNMILDYVAFVNAQP